MDMNKKGIFFTLMSVVILSLFLAGYLLYSNVNNTNQDRERISTMNNFLFSVEKDLPRQLYISGFRTIFLIGKETIETGNYIQNINQTFNDAFFNGEINGKPQEVMLGATFSDIQENLQQKAKKLNINITLSDPQIYVYQEDPWNVKFKLNVNLEMQDNSGLASWNKTQNYITEIPIEDFNDPSYILNTNGVVNNKFRKSPYNFFVNGSNVSNLLNHTLESYYINSTTAPSFLERLQGLTSPDKNGIESLINLQLFTQNGIPTKEKTVVDYIYFSEENPSTVNIQGMPSWFELDANHIEIYGVSNLTS